MLFTKSVTAVRRFVQFIWKTSVDPGSQMLVGETTNEFPTVLMVTSVASSEDESEQPLVSGSADKVMFIVLYGKMGVVDGVVLTINKVPFEYSSEDGGLGTNEDEVVGEGVDEVSGEVFLLRAWYATKMSMKIPTNERPTMSVRVFIFMGHTFRWDHPGVEDQTKRFVVLCMSLVLSPEFVH